MRVNRKLFALTAVAAVAALVSPATAAGPKQSVDGVVVAPAPYTDDSGCFAGVHRRVAIATQEQANGLSGYHFDVAKATVGGKFKLEPTGGAPHVDLDIYFYSKFGTVDDVVNDPGGAGAPATIQFSTREAGGESGIVPKGYPKAIVCLYGGAQGAGAGATFTYQGFAPVKKR